MKIKQLDPPLWFDTPKGTALCHFLIDYGPEHDLFWVCFNDRDGECWTWPNPKIKITKNISLGRDFNFPEVTQTESTCVNTTLLNEK